MKKTIRAAALIGLLGLLSLAATSAQAADPYVNVTVGGVLRPGVYGRIEIGNAPPPPVYYPQPVVISQPVVVVSAPVQPVYLYVPPGHQKKWGKHCAKYNACGQPVYFVNMAQYKGKRDGRGYGDDDDERGHGEGHGKGKHKYKDKS